VLEALNGDVDHAVFSFIPNTAESAYMGPFTEVEHMIRRGARQIWQAIERGNVTREDLGSLVNGGVRMEKTPTKKRRTFITHDAAGAPVARLRHQRGADPTDTLV
jgi:amidophosphoribosyltransferase